MINPVFVDANDLSVCLYFTGRQMNTVKPAYRALDINSKEELILKVLKGELS
ncbi:hypothetical protein [Lewinella cohaerens]|uniref:hypothetical protein n=1 Tax=Lewinella cohaerens TaxID=70995 RepID=UPI00146DC212|nr:hypothetical protein [Lewinella cohaerens]